MEQQLTLSSYTCGIIVESIGDLSVLEAFRIWLVHERIAEMPMDEAPVWHIREYHIPSDELAHTIQVLEKAIKPGWYVHLFNMAEDILYVILSGKSFRLPLERDEQWDTMIEYGLTVGVERKWTENIPVGRV